MGTLRKVEGKLADMFPEEEIAAQKEFSIDRDAKVFGALLELLASGTVPHSVPEEELNNELKHWGMPDIDELELEEEEDDDTESDSPQKQVPSNVRVPVDVGHVDSRLDAKYSMRSDEMFGRAIALVRQEDTIVKISDIQHGLALLRELLTIERNNAAFMFYLAYGEMRLGRTAEAIYWVDRVLKIDPANLAAASLKTLINDRRKQNSITGLIVLGGVVLAAGISYWITKSNATIE